MARKLQRRPKMPVFATILTIFALGFAAKLQTATITVSAMSLFSNNESKKVPRIDQWKISVEDGTLTGIVSGHPILEDGDEITTSPLCGPDFAEGYEGAIVTTLSGTKFKLETPKNNNGHKQSGLLDFLFDKENVGPLTVPSWIKNTKETENLEDC